MANGDSLTDIVSVLNEGYRPIYEFFLLVNTSVYMGYRGQSAFAPLSRAVAQELPKTLFVEVSIYSAY